MGKIRCPMCSKLNADDQEVCQFCQARLKPLVASSQDFSPVPPGGDEEVPEWLRSLGDPERGTPEDKPDEEPSGTTGAEQNEDWLARLGMKDDEDLPAPQFEIQDDDLDDETTPPSEDFDPDSPQWLRNIRAAASHEITEPPLGVPVIPPERPEDLDWLERLRQQKRDDEPLAPIPPLEESSPEEKPAEIPDWLTSFGDLASAGEIGKTSAADKPPGEELPDWLGDFSPSPDEQSQSSGQQAPEKDQAAGEQIPGWLEKAPGGQSEPSDAPGKPPQQPSFPVWPQVDWDALPEPAQPETGGHPPSRKSELGTPPEVESKPDWLLELESRLPLPNTDKNRPPGSIHEQDILPGEVAPETELPDWLSGFGSTGEVPREGSLPGAPRLEEETEEEGLAPAELPGWVQALRPIETVAPETAGPKEVEQSEEKSGPLAGLRGTLPAEPSAGYYGRPQTYGARLVVNETQQRYSQILEELLANEREPQPSSPVPLVSSQRVVRLVLAVLVLAAVLYPLLSGTGLVPIPTLYSQEVIHLQSAIELLPQGSPVLVALEYQPSLAGEMQVAAEGVIRHLMSRGARLVIISTSQTGPLLAENLLATANQEYPEYQNAFSQGEHAANLGYLAGGPAGLLGFALRPQLAISGAILPTGGRSWAVPALQGIQTLADFAQVIVLTDEQSSGRAWLEQVQPRLAETTPLLIVASAQAAPVLRPYLDGGQLDGMVVGLAGGASYEQLTGQPGQGKITWDSFQTGMVASLVIILIGGLAYLTLALLDNRKPIEEG